MLFSRNHTDGAWATRAPRRLRNVVVAMEWVPRADALALRKASVIDSGALTEGQEAALRQAFKLLDIDDSGRLDANEVRELLAAVHSDVDVEDLLAARIDDGLLDADGSGDFDFEEVARALRSQALTPTLTLALALALTLTLALALALTLTLTLTLSLTLTLTRRRARSRCTWSRCTRHCSASSG